MSYLGHVISRASVSIHQTKIAAIVDWHIPQSMKSLRRFLGLAGFYRCFVKGYTQVVGPLNTLLRKDGFKWNEAAEEAFLSLKKILTTMPLLRLPDFSIPFTVEMDASGAVMGLCSNKKAIP